MKVRVECDSQRILSDLEIARKYYEKYKRETYDDKNGYLKSFFEGQMVILCRLLDTPTEEFLSISFEEFKENYFNRERKWRAYEII